MDENKTNPTKDDLDSMAQKIVDQASDLWALYCSTQSHPVGDYAYGPNQGFGIMSPLLHMNAINGGEGFSLEISAKT